jgi:hypothetical protein
VRELAIFLFLRAWSAATAPCRRVVLPTDLCDSCTRTHVDADPQPSVAAVEAAAAGKLEGDQIAFLSAYLGSAEVGAAATALGAAASLATAKPVSQTRADVSALRVQIACSMCARILRWVGCAQAAAVTAVAVLEKAKSDAEAQQLAKLLASPAIQSVLRAYDRVAFPAQQAPAAPVAAASESTAASTKVRNNVCRAV